MAKEHHLLWFVLAVFAVIVIWEYNKPSAVIASAVDNDPTLSNVQTPDNSSVGPSYLLFNSPYAFSPPVQNILPRTSVGQIGQIVDTNTCGGMCNS